MIGRGESPESRVRAALAMHAETRALAAGPLEAVAGGLSNHAWRGEANGRRFFVRLGGEGASGLGVDREAEGRLVAAAAAAGLSPALVVFDPGQDLMVTDWIDGAPWDREAASRPGNLERLGVVLGSLHRLTPEAGWKRVSFAMQARHLAGRLAEVGVEDAALNEAAGSALDALEAQPVRLTACHNDLHHLNVVDDGRRLWLVDWEYGGAGDPLFDLASFLCQQDCTPAGRGAFLRATGADERAVGESLDRACLVFDYVQWLWYRASAVQAGEPALEYEARARAITGAVTVASPASSRERSEIVMLSSRFRIPS